MPNLNYNFYNPKYFIDKFLIYCKKFYNETGIIPSFQTINENNTFNNLPLLDFNFIAAYFYKFRNFIQNIFNLLF